MSYVPSMTIEELVHAVQDELTMSCALDKMLPDKDIRRIIELKAMPWFYRNVDEATQKMYCYVNKQTFTDDEKTGYKRVTLAPEVQAVVWVYETGHQGLFSLGLGSGVVNAGASLAVGSDTQPQLNSFMQQVADITTYRTVIETFADQVNSMTKSTVKTDFNVNNKQLTVLTSLRKNLILEVYANIEPEFLFADPMFYEYVTALSLIQLGNMLTRFTMPLPGEVQVNGADIKAEGTERKKAVEDKINGRSNSSFFFMVKR